MSSGLDNHDGVITYLKPDIPESKVKLALGSITMNKASGDDGILAELFKILKDYAVKVLHSICQHILKTPQWSRDLKTSVLPKEGQCQRMFKLLYSCAHVTCYQGNA